MPRRCGRPARSAVVTVTVTVTAAARRPWSPPRGTGVTAFPAAEADAASFDTGLVQRYGAEQIGKGHNVALSPAINILRVPYWDRAAETFGADPYLTSQMAVAEVKGLRQRGAPPRPGAVP